jgi:hypothetical protein
VALLSGLIRSAAITGQPDAVDASWLYGRQGGRWANQMVAGAMPTRAAGPAPPPPQPAAVPADTLRDLDDLHRRGVLTDAEFAGLRARLGA